MNIIRECAEMIQNGRLEQIPNLYMRAWDNEKDGSLADLGATLSFLLKEDFDFQSLVRQSTSVRQGCASKVFTGSGPCQPAPQNLTLCIYLEAGKYTISITLFDKMIFSIESVPNHDAFLNAKVLDVPSEFVQMSYFVSSLLRERVVVVMDRINSATRKNNEDVSRFLISP